MLEFVFVAVMILVFIPGTAYFGFRTRPAMISVSNDHWRAWRRWMPVRLVRTSIVMVTASFVLTLAYLVLTMVESKEQVFSANC